MAVIKVEDLSKQYRLGQVGTGTLSHDLNRWWHKIRGKEDPYLKIGDVNDRAKRGHSEYVWALQDINFAVEQGEVLGIIGKNGAGKSTLLKILSKVTGPTTGSIKAKGRIASLLEVGTGFHQELTGRENIYLNGTILGMTKVEVSKKLDEIVDFAGVERYLDTPVKRYSSGMMVRLGFAVAAHLEPEILIVDEVLAVGDAEFQKKAVGKMKEVSSQGGRTVLFVSHNMGSIQKLCTQVILLKKGEIYFQGKTEDAVEEYLKSADGNSTISSWYKCNVAVLNQCPKDVLEIKSIKILNLSEKTQPIKSGDDLMFELKIKLKKKIASPAFVFSVKDRLGVELFRLSNLPISGFPLNELEKRDSIKLTLFNLPLVKGSYFIDIGFVHEKIEWFFNAENLITLNVEGSDIYNSGFILDNSRGRIWVNHKWE